MKYLQILCLIILTSACNSNLSLQQYFVEKSEDSDFLIVDLPASVLGLSDNGELSEEDKEALASFKKLNILAFRNYESNTEQLNEELKTIRAILTSYDELITFRDPQFSGTILVRGQDNNLDEVVVHGMMSEKGFVIARILGDNMRVDRVASLARVLQNADLNTNALNSLQELF